MLLLLVPRVGFEPTALGLEVLCSILLSYRGIVLFVTFVSHEPFGYRRLDRAAAS